MPLNAFALSRRSAKTGENVEEAFLDTAKKIYQNIQDGSLDLNVAETGVTPKRPEKRTDGAGGGGVDGPAKDGCAC